MTLLLFWLFSALMLGFGIAVVANRSPVASALSLVVSFLGLASLFVMLDAYFIGIIQILVYAGAVMVLFLFIIMLLDLRAEKRRRFNLVATAGGGAVAVLFGLVILFVLNGFADGKKPFPELAGPVDDVRAVGRTLFGLKPEAVESNATSLQTATSLTQTNAPTSYNLPLQVIGVLVLVATVGVVVLSKREMK